MNKKIIAIGIISLFMISGIALNAAAQPTDEASIEKYFAEKLMSPVITGNQHYTYGQDLYWQVDWCVRHFNESGHRTNHCYMTVGRPETLLHYDKGIIYVANILATEACSGKEFIKREMNNAWNKKKPELSARHSIRRYWLLVNRYQTGQVCRKLSIDWIPLTY